MYIFLVSLPPSLWAIETLFRPVSIIPGAICRCLCGVQRFYHLIAVPNPAVSVVTRLIGCQHHAPFAIRVPAGNRLPYSHVETHWPDVSANYPRAAHSFEDSKLAKELEKFGLAREPIQFFLQRSGHLSYPVWGHESVAAASVSVGSPVSTVRAGLVGADWIPGRDPKECYNYFKISLRAPDTRGCPST